MKDKPVKNVHPFGELLSQYRLRKAGLTQKLLAELAGYDQSTLVRMCKGGKDLTGPSGRDRVLRLVGTLLDSGVIHTRDEANSLLFVAQMPPLFEAQPAEAALLKRLEFSSGIQTRRTNLPTALTSFLGRSAEQETVQRLLANTRMLTLTGAGGSGKTRLAQAVAARTLLAYPDGVWYVELSSAIDEDQVLQQLAAALSIAIDNAMPVRERVINHLRQSRALLVLDNCEHLIDAVAALTSALLRACPQLTVLATSREALNIDGETTWRVPSLQSDDAAALFIERARARQYEPGVAQQPLVAEICRRLDHMPLAIELAAARVDTLTVAEIVARLDNRFALLTQARRDAGARHQTLRAAMDWSYELLSPAEQHLFCQLSVFVGGWTLSMAEDLAAEMGIPREEVLPVLTQLASKSLIQVDRHDSETRYGMLETLRDYGAERVRQESPHAIARLQEAHARAIAHWCEQAGQHMRAAFTRELFARIDRNYPNVHAVLSRGFAADGGAELAIGVVAHLGWFWHVSSRYPDREHWHEQAEQSVTRDTPPVMRARLIMNHCANRAIPHPEDLDQLAQAQTLFEQNGQDGFAAVARGLIAILRFVFKGHDAVFCDDLRDAISRLRRAGIHTHARGFTYQLCAMIANRGRLDEASVLIEQSAAECRETCDDYHLSQFLYLHAHIHMERLAFAQALALMQEAERVAHQALDPRQEMLARTLVAENLRFLGDPARAASMAAECVFYAQHTMGDFHDEVPIYVLTKALTDCARFDEAHAQIHGLFARLDKARGAVASLYFNGFDAMARNLSAAGRAAEAAYLFGAADGDLERSKQRRFSQNYLECAPLIARAKEALGDADYQRHYAAGRAAELAQAIQFALTH